MATNNSNCPETNFAHNLRYSKDKTMRIAMENN